MKILMVPLRYLSLSHSICSMGLRILTFKTVERTMQENMCEALSALKRCYTKVKTVIIIISICILKPLKTQDFLPCPGFGDLVGCPIRALSRLLRRDVLSLARLSSSLAAWGKRRESQAIKEHFKPKPWKMEMQ